MYGTYITSLLMKTKFVVGGLAALLLFAGFAGAKTLMPNKNLIVHEWGTFTTLHASDGTRLSGLYFDEEQLPAFVYEHSDVAKRSDAVQREKGFDISPANEPQNVTVKMETPVIYFYSPKTQKVNVRANFPAGIISQWYPQNTAGNTMQNNWDFKKPYRGWMNWQVRVLPPNSAPALTPPKEQETEIWTSPRATDANLIQSHKGEIEKFIFYRGVANFSIPVATKFSSDNKLVIKNTGQTALPKIFVYEKKTDGSDYVWWSGKLERGSEQTVDLSAPAPAKADFTAFEQALTDAGLYPKEAKAMLATWKRSYFEHPGLRVFWIVPEQKVNELLPLKISPRPAETKRVFMGRIDLLTPAFEKQLLEDFRRSPTLPAFNGDRYYKGYRERAEQLSKQK